MKATAHVARIGCLAAAAFLAGCASADVGAPIRAFSQATAAAKSTLEDQQKLVDQRLVALALSETANPDGPDIKVYDRECEATSPRCRLYIPVDGRRLPINEGAANHGALDVMGALKAYADGLTNIVNAQSQGEIATATATAKAGLLALAGSVDDLTSTPKNAENSLSATASRYATPVTTLVTVGLERYVEAVKLRALRDAVSGMQQIFPKAMTELDRLVRDSIDYERREKHKDYAVAFRNYLKSRKDAGKIAEYAAAAEQLDKVLRIQHDDVFGDLGDAHAALYNALQGRDRSFNELWPIINRIIEKTKAIADALQQIEDAAKTKAGAKA